jgi:hypothetical protein
MATSCTQLAGRYLVMSDPGRHGAEKGMKPYLCCASRQLGEWLQICHWLPMRERNQGRTAAGRRRRGCIGCGWKGGNNLSLHPKTPVRQGANPPHCFVTSMEVATRIFIARANARHDGDCFFCCPRHPGVPLITSPIVQRRGRRQSLFIRKQQKKTSDALKLPPAPVNGKGRVPGKSCLPTRGTTSKELWPTPNSGAMIIAVPDAQTWGSCSVMRSAGSGQMGLSCRTTLVLSTSSSQYPAIPTSPSAGSGISATDMANMTNMGACSRPAEPPHSGGSGHRLSLRHRQQSLGLT